MLVSLEIYGFKSFPESTHIDFDTGITAIVGPNGSGKSNVTDAIRWGLSEQSAKLLRGQKMSDMIFNGTAQRRPMSYAEVILTFDNSRHILDIDFDTVSIARRYHRSGESEYFINKSPCRLKDVNDLLVDTGIGLDGYSIVGQGKIDEILNDNEDRRLIFDEASGIVQFKKRKAESERRLERANQNLLRVDDILEELRRQAGPLKKQAEDAKHFEELNSSFRQLDLSISWQLIQKYEADSKEAEELQKINALNLGDAEAALKSINKKNTQIDDEISVLDQYIETERNNYNALSIKKADTTGSIALSRERESSARDRQEQLKDEKDRLEIQISVLKDNLDGRHERYNQLKKQCEIYHKRLDTAESVLSTATEGLNESEKTTDNLIIQREKLKDALFQINSDMQTAKAEDSILHNQLSDLSKELDENKSELNRAIFALEEADVLLNTLTNEIAELEIEAKNSTDKRLIAEQSMSSLDQRIKESKAKEKELRYEEETLRRLEQNFEGYQRPVKNLMQATAKDNMLAEGVIGPLASLLKIPDDLEIAIDVALGAMLHNIVCDNENTAKKLISYLRDQRLGRVTFLPQDALQTRKINQRDLDGLRGEPGFVGLASDLVEIRAGLEKVLDYSLGRILIANTLDDAIKIARKSGRNYRVVSRNGDLIHPGGSMTGGSLNAKQSGLAGRPARIKSLMTERNVLNDKITELELAHSSSVDHLHHVAAEEEQALNLLADKRKSLNNAELDFKTKTMTQAALKASLNKTSDALLKASEQSAKAKDLYTKSSQEVEYYQSQISKLDEKINLAEHEKREATQKRELLRDDVTHLKISLASLEESLTEIDSDIRRSDEEGESNQKRLKEIADALIETANRINAEQENVQEAKSKLSLIETDLQKLEQLLEESSKQLLAKQQEKRSLYQVLQDKSEEVGILRSEATKLDSARDRVKEQRDDELNRIWENYNLTLHEIESKTVTIESQAQAKRERNKIKNLLDNMGAINHNAMADYDAVKQRLSDSEAQRADIEKAKSELNDVIASLEHAMRERFTETFHRINQNFSQVFSELFNGGIAQLSLSDSDDVLDANIEIRAQPPGKKLSRLSLLSGGERCLTAIALIFAILNLKPTPFVVFDEIESSLDDVNSQRFANYVKEYSDTMQFILVTHRKPSMEVADRLYGVTMQERGISRILSMKLSSVNQE